MRIGFIGLGNVGSKLAGCLLRNGFDLIVRDLDRAAAAPLLAEGARWGETPKEIALAADLIITCLPSPDASAAVMEADDGILAGLSPGKIWAEMSTTDREEVLRLGARVFDVGAFAMDCPVSGGCHRAASGNISIFAGGEREAFDAALPALAAMGRRILHAGPLGSASVLKVVTNYLAAVHLAALGEALCVSKAAGVDLAVAFEAIRISSGNSFVHETESRVILNGSYKIDFTMDLVHKDLGLFADLAARAGVPLEIAPEVVRIFADGRARYGPRAWSSQIVRRLEDDCGIHLRAPGFAPELVDDEPQAPGYEVTAKHESTPA